jgi:histidinol phosphatase-like enzyme
MGLFTADALGDVETRLSELFGDAGAPIDGYFWCTHARPRPAQPDACACRKPRPGLIESAARVHGLDVSLSWMIGDILDDIEAGHRAGCRAILVDRGGETEWRPGALREPDAIVTRFDRAARHILASDVGVRAPVASSCAGR